MKELLRLYHDRRAHKLFVPALLALKALRMDLLLQRILRSSPVPAPVSELRAWWPRYAAAAHGLTLPVERAVAAGFAADRLGYAFAAGYTEALHQLLPGLGDTRAALCATEAGGVHPRAIQTHLTAAGDGLRLCGDKTFVSLGTHATTLLIVASEGQDEQGRNRLALWQLPADRPGVTPDERLPGDAYERYLKPFRTVEDLHVQAAFLGWLLQVARRASWPRVLVQVIRRFT